MPSKIEYTHETWNPVVGCAHSGSPGCDHCYAAKMAWRLAHIPATRELYEGLTRQTESGRIEWTGKVRVNENALATPLHWHKPRRVFLGSMTDWMFSGIPSRRRLEMLAVMALTPRHRYLTLTKRHLNLRPVLETIGDHDPANLLAEAAYRITSNDEAECQVANAVNNLLAPEHNVGWPLRNLALGVTVCNQAEADEKIPLLLATPAAIRWVSVEPMLGPVDLTAIKAHAANHCANALHALDWVVAGGESGHGARPVHPDWLRSLRDQCASADVPFFFKQWGEWSAISQLDDSQFGQHEDWPNSDHIAHLRGPDVVHLDDPCPVYRVGKRRAGRLLDSREHNDMPEALRVAVGGQLLGAAAA